LLAYHPVRIAVAGYLMAAPMYLPNDLGNPFRDPAENKKSGFDAVLIQYFEQLCDAP
jgi:hypothetical protein